ncbi:MAG: Xanthine dehydrogenase [Deltaproteobacteria bacterium]|nr:Xanthine dehydrogenase [Deltaproteobacteria bacterium]
MRIGESVPRLDARSKVAGIEKYAADYYRGADGSSFLWVGVRRAGVAHGLIESIDVTKAWTVPGVTVVLTCKDIKGPNRQGVVRKDQCILAETKVRHAGDPVALVIAETRTALKEAIALVEMTINPLPGVFSLKEALVKDAVLIHEENETGNIVREINVVKGRGDAGFDECDVIVEMSFETPRQEHAYLETEAGWACMETDGTLVIVASTQTPFRDRLETGHALGLDPERIRVIAPHLGGAFGGKDGLTVQAFLALAALHSHGRPVKMWWDREESFIAGVKRLPARMEYRLGATRDGVMTALSCRLFFDSGAYANLSGEIMTLGVEHAGGPYRIPHVSIRGCSVYTNNGLGGPFRGFGVPQTTAIMEQIVDLLADRLAMDPLKLRLKNALIRGDENCAGVAMTRSTNVKACLDVVEAHPFWQERGIWKESAGPFTRRGTGVVCLLHAMGYPKDVPDRAGAKIELTEDGVICVSTGVVDMGQGNSSTYLQMAGEILSQDKEHLKLILPDTARTLPGGSASASRCTYVFGNALVEAARALKGSILKKAAAILHTIENDLELEPGCVCRKATGRRLPLSQVAALLSDEERIVATTYTSPTAKEDSAIIYLGPHLLYSYAAHLARIEVDELTGEVEIKDYLAVTDGGSVLNPQIYEQQIQGSIAQGVGYALTERFLFEKGYILTPNLATYTIPTAPDIPDMTSMTVELPEETGPFGMKGVGEIAINGPLPAIANALCDAIGVRFDTAPFTAEAVLEAMTRQSSGDGQ